MFLHFYYVNIYNNISVKRLKSTKLIKRYCYYHVFSIPDDMTLSEYD